MKKVIPLLLIVATIGTSSFGQNQFPNLDANALVKYNFNLDTLNKPYTLIVYGGVGCGYSQYLIENLGVLSTCKDKCDIILIMDQPKDSITKHMNNIIELYPTFTNTILQYRLRKKADIFPQLLLFKNRVQIDHVVGVKEGMLSNVKKMILVGK
ncbi:hypothetical protein [Phnomibacter sp. MR]|uniref:hypothetical protein n=1 Tax=Phnomibacter sp. MR TaxID=3042318 RepID=UPI003A7F7727